VKVNERAKVSPCFSPYLVSEDNMTRSPGMRWLFVPIRYLSKEEEVENVGEVDEV
jgi:hypothetical protein